MISNFLYTLKMYLLKHSHIHIFCPHSDFFIYIITIKMFFNMKSEEEGEVSNREFCGMQISEYHSYILCTYAHEATTKKLLTI